MSDFYQIFRKPSLNNKHHDSDLDVDIGLDLDLEKDLTFTSLDLPQYNSASSYLYTNNITSLKATFCY